MKNLILAIGLLFSFQIFANIIKVQDHFKEVGKISSFQWAPERYKNDFRYDIFYYIPKALETSSNVPALVFMHGGGESTTTRDGSIWAVNLYLPDLQKIADELNMVIIAPSANGLNWGGHTRGMLKDLLDIIRTELDINADNIGLSGHSMGGMGITRNYFWLSDEFAYFLPQAAGMDERHQTEENLNKLFNVPYVHLQGLQDHFGVFITRAHEQMKRVGELEAKYQVKSKFEMQFYQGGHGYDLALFKGRLAELTQRGRNLYQKELWGSLNIINQNVVDNKISFNYNSISRYFWIEALEMDESLNERFDFRAKITGNRIDLHWDQNPQSFKGLRLYLHSNMVDLDQPVVVFINGQLATARAPAKKDLRNFDQADPGFNFHDVLDISLVQPSHSILKATATCEFKRGRYEQTVIGRLIGNLLYEGRTSLNIIGHLDRIYLREGRFGFNIIGHMVGNLVMAGPVGYDVIGRLEGDCPRF